MVQFWARSTPACASAAHAGQHRVTLAATLDLDISEFSEQVRRRDPGRRWRPAVSLLPRPLLDGVRVAQRPVRTPWLQSERARLSELALDALRRLVDPHLKAGHKRRPSRRRHPLLRLRSCSGGRSAHLHCACTSGKAVGRPRCASTRRAWPCCGRRSASSLNPEQKNGYSVEIVRGTRPGRPAARPAYRLGHQVAAADAPIVGRESGRARARLRLASRGDGQHVVTGEAGIGRSHLIEELVATAATHGARVLLGRAAPEPSRSLPFRSPGWMPSARDRPSVKEILDSPAALPSRATSWPRLFPELTPSSRAASASPGRATSVVVVQSLEP